MSRHSPRMPVLLGALTLAMRGRTFQPVTVLEVDELRARAEAILPEGCQLRAGVMAFATRFEAARRDPFALHDAGEDLHRAVLREMWTAPDAGRVDIHG